MHDRAVLDRAAGYVKLRAGLPAARQDMVRQRGARHVLPFVTVQPW